MFFVGITGSLLPYLFLLGIVFVFSTQTSALSMEDAQSIDGASIPAHQIYFPVSSEAFSDSDYLTTLECFCNFSIKSSVCKGDSSECVWCISRFQELEESENRFEAHEMSFKSQLTEFYFFGLSPPLSFML